jgi:hemolysin III
VSGIAPLARTGPDPMLKPRLRGVSHQWAFLASLFSGAALIAIAPTGEARLAASVYAASMAALFGTSALYHRVNWRSVAARRRMRRADHSAIFLLIAGTYTPVALLALKGWLASAILIAVWAGAAGGIVLKLAWIDAPKPVIAAIYLVLGWVAVAALPEVARRLGWAPTALIIGGGVLYTAGAIVYARQRPDPWPATFGYHEVFHALVIGAAVMHYAAVAAFVIPRGT